MRSPFRYRLGVRRESPAAAANRSAEKKKRNVIERARGRADGPGGRCRVEEPMHLRRGQRCCCSQQRRLPRCERNQGEAVTPRARLERRTGTRGIRHRAAGSAFRRGGRMPARDRAAHCLGVLGRRGNPQACQQRECGENEGGYRALRLPDSTWGQVRVLGRGADRLACAPVRKTWRPHPKLRRFQT